MSKKQNNTARAQRNFNFLRNKKLITFYESFIYKNENDFLMSCK